MSQQHTINGAVVIGPANISGTGTWTIGPIPSGTVFRTSASAEFIKTKQEFNQWNNENWKHIDNFLIVLDKLDLL